MLTQKYIVQLVCLGTKNVTKYNIFDEDCRKAYNLVNQEEDYKQS